MSGCENTIMDDEAIEISLQNAKKLQQMGFMDVWHYETFKSHAATGLVKFGDPFQKALGEALMNAFLDDSIKILRYWAQECEQHSLLYKMYLAKEKANASG